MDSDAVARIEDWETHPVGDGHGGLHDLSDAEFSGAVTNGSGWLFMLNGRILGVFNGTIEAFDGVGLTAHTAPHPSLPLLFAMQETGGETQAKYYTDDTPITEVNQTLTEGGFTGYIELSENVLSGDYYVVYYGGRSLSAAFIGNAEQLLTGDEAFERANDEVGIYEVRSVDLEVEELPDPTSASTAADDEEPATADTGAAVEAGSEEAGSTAEPAGVEEAESPDAGSTEPDPATEESSPTEATPAGTERVEDDSPSEPVDTSTGQTSRESEAPKRSMADSTTSTAPGEGSETPATDPASGSSQDPFSEEEEWRETRTIPALDPDRSEDSPREASEADRQAAPQDQNQGGGRAAQPSQPQSRSTPQTGQQPQQGQDLRAALEAREGRIEELEANLQELVSERDELAEARDQLMEERDELEERISRLESQLESVTGKASGTDVDGVTTELDPGEALTQTDVFIRYGSKGDATLESAHDGRVGRDEVLSNLMLEEHTRFDSDTATVTGQPYLEFLENSLQYRFVKWLVEDLIFEIQETNSQKRLKALYNVLPRFDRAEFVGTVTSRDEDGEEHTETFDVVIRDRMGQPLIVADFNDARDPATGDMMSDLVTRATVAAEGHDTIGSAFLVTASFFEPTALETADEATGGGLLDRDSKESFVKLGRKRGFHLCLAEARGDAFHIAVPEL